MDRVEQVEWRPYHGKGLGADAVWVASFTLGKQCEPASVEKGDASILVWMEIGKAVQSLLRDILPPAKCAIDLGIGSGRIVDVLQERGFDVYGCDIDPEHAERARARGSMQTPRTSSCGNPQDLLM